MANPRKRKKAPVKRKSGKKAARKAQRQRWSTVDRAEALPTEQVQVDSAGRVVLPARFRRELGIDAGDPVTITLEDDVLRVRTIQASLEKARALMRKTNPDGDSLVDELIAERRAEAERE